VARDPSHPGHIMPVFKPHYRRILDVGCGMGQTLIAASLPPEVVAHGIDPDTSAIEAGQRIAPANVRLSVGQGERLQFPDSFFDLVICRVALPYMHIERALAEMHRVLTPGGDAWLVLHPMSMYRERVRECVRRRELRGLLSCGWLGANSLLFNTTGKQLTTNGRTESFQTEAGIRRALKRAGLECLRVQREPFFVAEARKPS
jgi:SAM-dependent methyltransferase